MKQFWYQLQPREQRTIIIGLIALVPLLLYMVVWEPYQSEMERLEQTVVSLQKDVNWMRSAAVQFKGRGGGEQRTAIPPGQSLLSLVDQTAKANKLGDGLKRVQPDGERNVKVWLEQVAFDDVMQWLGDLNRRYGVKVSGLVAEKQNSPGIVNVRLVLEGAA